MKSIVVSVLAFLFATSAGAQSISAEETLELSSPSIQLRQDKRLKRIEEVKQDLDTSRNLTELADGLSENIQQLSMQAGGIVDWYGSCATVEKLRVSEPAVRQLFRKLSRLSVAYFEPNLPTSYSDAMARLEAECLKKDWWSKDLSGFRRAALDVERWRSDVLELQLPATLTHRLVILEAEAADDELKLAYIKLASIVDHADPKAVSALKTGLEAQRKAAHDEKVDAR